MQLNSVRNTFRESYKKLIAFSLALLMSASIALAPKQVKASSNLAPLASSETLGAAGVLLAAVDPLVLIAVALAIAGVALTSNDFENLKAIKAYVYEDIKSIITAGGLFTDGVLHMNAELIAYLQNLKLNLPTSEADISTEGALNPNTFDVKTFPDATTAFPATSEETQTSISLPVKTYFSLTQEQINTSTAGDNTLRFNFNYYGQNAYQTSILNCDNNLPVGNYFILWTLKGWTNSTVATPYARLTPVAQIFDATTKTLVKTIQSTFFLQQGFIFNVKSPSISIWKATGGDLVVPVQNAIQETAHYKPIDLTGVNTKDVDPSTTIDFSQTVGKSPLTSVPTISDLATAGVKIKANSLVPMDFFGKTISNKEAGLLSYLLFSVGFTTSSVNDHNLLIYQAYNYLHDVKGVDFSIGELKYTATLKGYIQEFKDNFATQGLPPAQSTTTTNTFTVPKASHTTVLSTSISVDRTKLGIENKVYLPITVETAITGTDYFSFQINANTVSSSTKVLSSPYFQVYGYTSPQTYKLFYWVENVSQKYVWIGYERWINGSLSSTANTALNLYDKKDIDFQTIYHDSYSLTLKEIKTTTTNYAYQGTPIANFNSDSVILDKWVGADGLNITTGYTGPVTSSQVINGRIGDKSIYDVPVDTTLPGTDDGTVEIPDNPSGTITSGWLGTALQALFGPLITGIGNLIDLVKNIYDALVGAFITHLDSIVSFCTNFFTNLFSGLSDMLKNLFIPSGNLLDKFNINGSNPLGDMFDLLDFSPLFNIQPMEPIFFIKLDWFKEGTPDKVSRPFTEYPPIADNMDLIRNLLSYSLLLGSVLKLIVSFRPIRTMD